MHRDSILRHGLSPVIIKQMRFTQRDDMFVSGGGSGNLR